VAGDIALADDILSESVRTNGVTIGVAGSKRRIQERLAGFPDLAVDIEDMFSVRDKVITRLVWRDSYWLIYGHQGHRQASAGSGLCQLALRRRQSG
jgi:hypothetical protein